MQLTQEKLMGVIWDQREISSASFVVGKNGRENRSEIQAAFKARSPSELK